MLDGIRIYSSDPIWRQILSELGATVCDVYDPTYLDFDSLNLIFPSTPMEIKTAVQNAIDGNIKIFQDIFGKNVHLPHIQAQIVFFLYKSGGASAAELRKALGYSPNATTHAVDTAIYQLRKTFGKNFIINNNGVYKLGNV